MSHPTIKFWILGLNFFSNYYTVFDQEQLKLGFAISRYAHPRVLEFHQNSDLFEEELRLEYYSLEEESLQNIQPNQETHISMNSFLLMAVVSAVVMVLVITV
jgi:hypothetical protein